MAARVLEQWVHSAAALHGLQQGWAEVPACSSPAKGEVRAHAGAC